MYFRSLFLCVLVGAGFFIQSTPPTNHANVDKNYRALRDGKPEEAFNAGGITLKRDVATISLRSGTITFLPKVLEKTVVGVFTGDGEIKLEPSLVLEKQCMRYLTGAEVFSENFNRMMVYFTDATAEEIRKNGTRTQVDPRSLEVQQEFQKRLRRSTESPRSLVESLLHSGDVENIEAETLAALYNPKRAGGFNAYISGQKYTDLRFHVRPEGVKPSLPSPEEVALINLDPQAKEEGIIYLAHFDTENNKGTANSEEDKRTIDAEHYKIERRFAVRS